MIEKTFVGRSRELEQVRNWLKDSPGRLVLLSGPGGIGKTSLLSRLEKEYSAREDFVVEYFDLSEQPLTILNQALHLADYLGRENFPQFTQKLTTLESDAADPSALEEDALNAFVAETTFYLDSRKKKLLRIMDTFEIVLKYSAYGDDWAKGVNERLKQIPGVFFLIAGRDFLEERDVLAEVMPPLEKTFGRENILSLQLAGFDAVEMGDFFAECDPHHMIPDEMREKLQLLTDGKPILLSLAVEWLQKEIPLPSLTEQNLDDLKKLLSDKEKRQELLEDFEFELVSRIRQLQTPFDVASLYMAHIDRRMDASLLSILLGMEEDEAARNLEKIIRFPFVKEFVGVKPKKCVLHDEMNRLVKAHAWQYLDISGAERRGLTEKAIEKYYLPRIGEFRKQKQELLRETHSTLMQDVEARKDDLERWLLEAEILYYHIKLGREEGYRYFDQVFYDEGRTPVRDQILIDELKRSGTYDKNKIDLRRADELLRRSESGEAKRLCLEVLSNPSLDESVRLHALNTLGLCNLESAPFSAEENFEQALKLAQAKNDVRKQIIIRNNLGRLLRNVSRLQESIEQFEAALNLALASGNFEMSGSIRNNMAWTHRLNGELDDAEALCSLAIAENRRYGQERPLAYAYLTKADIDRDKGDLNSAEQYAALALDTFNRLEDAEGKIQAFRTWSAIFRSLREYEKALAYLDDGISLARAKNANSLLASLYQLRGRTCRHYFKDIERRGENADADYETKRGNLLMDALGSLRESLQISQQVGNRWEAARSQLEIILIMLSQEAYDESDLLKQLDSVWNIAEDLNDEFLRGYVHENHARIEMKNGDYFNAGRALGKAACHIANGAGVEVARTFDRLYNTLLDFRLTPQQTKDLVRGLYEQVKSYEGYEEYPKLAALIKMCGQMLGMTVSREAA